MAFSMINMGNQKFSNIYFVSFILATILFQPGCTSLREIREGAVQNFILPLIKIQERSLSSESAGSDDFKLVDSRMSGIRLVLRRGAFLSDVPENIQSHAWFIASRTVSAPDVQLVELPAEILAKLDHIDASVHPALREKHIDGILDVKFSQTEESDNRGFVVSFRMLDPYDGKELSSIKCIFQIRSRRVDPAHQAEFVRTGGKISFLNDDSDQMPVLTPVPEDNAVRDFIWSSITGKLNVLSTAGETEVLLAKEDARADTAQPIGKTPVTGWRLDEGKYRLSVRRRGQASVEREVQIRAGRTSDVFITWPEDPGITALSVLTAPPGLRISLNGTVAGNSPLFLTGAGEGSYAVEVSRSGEGGQYRIAGESNVSLAKGDQKVRVFFIDHTEDFNVSPGSTDYWQLSTTDGTIQSGIAGGLFFKTTSKAPDVWQGLVSREFAFESFVTEIEVVEGSGNILGFGVITDDDSFLAEMNSDRYTVASFQGKNAARLVNTFQSIQPSQTGVRKIKLSYNRTAGKIEARLDGDVMYEGFWNPGRIGNLVVMTRSTSADGRPLARRLTIKTFSDK